MSEVTQELCVRKVSNGQDGNLLIAELLSSAPPLTTTPGVSFSYDRRGDRKCSRQNAVLCEHGQLLIDKIDMHARDLGVKEVWLMSRTIRIVGYADFRSYESWCLVSSALNT